MTQKSYKPEWNRDNFCFFTASVTSKLVAEAFFILSPAISILSIIP